MDALRFWSEWMVAKDPPSASVESAYAQMVASVEVGRTHGLAEWVPSFLSEIEGHDPRRGAAANHNLAVALQQDGDLDGAVFHCVRSLFLYHQVGDLPGTWAGLRNLAVIFQARGENRRSMDARFKGSRVRAAMVESGLFPDQEDGRDASGEPLLILSVSAGRELRKVV